MTLRGDAHDRCTARLGVMSSNFTAALRDVAAAIRSVGEPARLTLLWPQGEQRAYMFIGNPNQRTLAPYLLPAETPRQKVDAFDRNIVDRSYLEPPADTRAPGELIVILGEKMKLVKIIPPMK